MIEAEMEQLKTKLARAEWERDSYRGLAAILLMPKFPHLDPHGSQFDAEVKKAAHLDRPFPEEYLRS
jgi:hypothetical protein